MDQPLQDRLRDDLKGLVKGELLLDDLSRALYSTDASIFQIMPVGAVTPRDEEDLQAVVRYAASHQLALIPRGAGTGLAGESLGSGLILDLGPHFRDILAIEADTVRVQPGVVLRELNARLARDGRRFAPDPALEECTLGGMLATNASGARCLRHGYTRDYVQQIRAVLDSGEAVTLGRHPRPRPGEAAQGRLAEIVAAAAALLERHAESIRSCRPRTPFNRCGYLLHDLLMEDHVDLAKAVVGSEGTLAIFTEATLRTVPLPAGRSLVLLGFDSLETALRAAQLAVANRPTSCELLDRRLLSLARGSDAFRAVPIPPGAEAVLLVEFESDTTTGARTAAEDLYQRLQRGERLALHATTAYDREGIDRLWRLREAALPSLYGLRGGEQPVAFIEDVGVPVEELRPYLHRVQEVLKRYETTASFLVHAGSGQVHTRPFLDLNQPENVAKLKAIADDVYSLALDLGGTVSTQHGTGLSRTPWVARQYGPLADVFREFKAIFDPGGLLNPGKIVSLDGRGPVWPLRRSLSRAADEAAGANAAKAPARALRWQLHEIEAEVGSCNGCGQCRTEATAQRMCPIFRATLAEAATPRAKANLLRHVLNQGQDGTPISDDDVRAVADLCVNCKMCGVECPAHVNIPKLMLEAKAANVAEHGLVRSDWVLARTESFARLGSAFAFVVNTGLRSRSVRWFLEWFFGISRQRRLPRFAGRSFLQRAKRAGWTRPPRAPRPRVAFFVDVFANFNDPQIAEAVVAVLHHNGIEVYVPPKQIGCGMAPLAYGDVEAAREAAQQNLRVLADLARTGYDIVCSEPTAALMLRHDYLDLVDDPDAKLVADRTVEFTSYLWDLHQQGRLRTDFQALEFAVGHHVPCHLKALGRPAAGPALLALIPGLRVSTIDVGCSGMAGTFGLKAANYATSLAAGRAMLDELRRPRVLFGSTECSTCRLQMEDGSGKRTLHPAQYLALAYGLMPGVMRRLQEPLKELTLR